MARVIVFGSLNVDFVTRVPAIPRPGQTVKGPSYVVLPGGKGANQALAAARTGAQVAMAGAVGRDPFADIALANLVAAGIDCSAVARQDAPTGAAFISVDRKGENAIAVASGANAGAKSGSLGALRLAAGDILLMQREVPDSEILAAIALARRAGAVPILNAAPAEAFSLPLLEGLGHLVVNEQEAAAIAAAADIASAEPAAIAGALCERFGVVAVITLGAEGALAASRGGLAHVEAMEVDVVDTTGAGDAFCGAYAAELAMGRTLEQALRAGTIVAGLTCERLGAQSGMPSSETIRLKLSA